MSERKIILGIDTSNYTTSFALMYSDGELIANIKRLLDVKLGERGLSQSDALYAHIRNIPKLVQEVKKALAGRQISAVGVSDKPRNVQGSYMPCFLAGVSAGESISAVNNIPLYKFSHQCGHIMATVYSGMASELLDGRSFVAFHVSGGTTEMLNVRATDGGFETSIIGGTADLNAGQLIDRVGVAMGLAFPAGVHMERLALQCQSKPPRKKPSIKGYQVNISGIENSALKLYADTGDKPLTALYVLDYISTSLCELCRKYENENGKTTFVFGGGVMSNSIIKERIAESFDAYFAEPSMSADNAVGIAVLTAREFSKK